MALPETRANPLLIAGPCSAETREQVMEAAAALADQRIHFFRAGVWKPRTKPGTFEGNGKEALRWLQEVEENYGMTPIIEVAEPAHIELALAYGLHAFWIGARTTVNPFQVQHLADAMRNKDVTVMIKNPVNPDIDLWEGAIERFERAGITRLAAIHRGFSSYHSSAYRNQPDWPIPIELKRRRPHMNLYCDPSHITGKRELVPEIAQRAMDLGFDGLMVETHPHPERAWSDAQQQITPDGLRELMKTLIVRQHVIPDATKKADLEYLRQLMDTVDAEIIDLLARRMELSEQMGLLKRECNLTVYSPERWQEIVYTRSARANSLHLSPAFILYLYERIHHESIKKQLSVLSDEEKAIKH